MPAKLHAVTADEVAPAHRPLRFDAKGIKRDQLRALHRQLVLPRLIEEKMLKLLRQGKLSKWFSGIGQEAVAVGVGSALNNTDYILPLHRNLGVFTSRGVPLERLFAQWQGKADSFTKGRDRSFHFGTPEHRIIGMISHLGAMLGVADGLALAAKLRKSGEIAIAFSGDGGASEGDFHEALNVAAVWELPVIFVVENNGYGLSTPSEEQFRCRAFVDKAAGYGMRGVQVDGNNVLEVYRTMSRLAAEVRETGQPVLLEAMTFRMRGHEEASGTRYVPQELFDIWGKKDPVDNFEAFLLKKGVLDGHTIGELRHQLDTEIQHAWDAASALPPPEPNAERELADVYAPSLAAEPALLDSTPTKRLRFVDAISEALSLGMTRDEELVIMGQDVAEYGGVFKITEGFVEKFGKARVRNTPLCESAILGAGLGLSIAGMPSVVEMQFADFVSCGFNQIVNNLAKTHYRWGQPVNVTVRLPTGGGVAAGPFHSQSTEAWFAHVPGLKVVYPATPADAKGLLLHALREPNPVLFYEHKLLYRSVEDAVPEGVYELPFGQARIARQGEDATIVTYGAGVHWALRLAEQRDDLDLEIIDLRTLAPWDKETVLTSLQKTNRCLVLHEDTITGGFGAEIAATLAQEGFDYLDAPIVRVGSLDTPVPFHKTLEEVFMASKRFEEGLERLLGY